ncbi:hypothetical protein Ancab_020635 [Ancistrocladus abbreviatus]
MLEKRRKKNGERGGDNEEFDFDGEGDGDISGQMWAQSLSRSLEEHALRRYAVSSSVPNVGLSNNSWIDDGPNYGDKSRGGKSQASSSSDDKVKLLSNGLLPLEREGKGLLLKDSGPNMRVDAVRSLGGNILVGVSDTDEEREELPNGNFIPAHNEMTCGATDPTRRHGSDSASQDSFAQSFRNETENYIQDQKQGANACEPKTSIALPEFDTCSVGIMGNDFAGNTVEPLSASIHETLNVEEEEVRKMIRECLDMRETYVYKEQVAPWEKSSDAENSSGINGDPFQFHPLEATEHHFRMEDGIVHVYASKNDTVELFPVASATTFFTDMHQLLKIISAGNTRSACYHRLRFLEEKFRLHLLVNADREFLAQKSAPHRDFYNIRKVDTHVHHSACMNHKHLLRFIKSKLRKEPDEVVIFRDGQYLTLQEVFESLDLTGYDLNVDLLDVHADKSTFHRFDKFNLKYNPCGQSRLREIFLKQDNLIQGRFLAEVTKEVLSDLEASKYQMAEYRISIYGRKQSEWDQLASWFINNKIYSANAVWLIQLPRLYNVYKKMGTVTSFQNILDNMFIPLFEVTVDPASHPQLHAFLMQVVGFDLVDDESKPERRPTKHMPKPAEWTNEFNPAYSYYAYYCYANLYTLNKLRELKGLPTIKLRPHCGEAGDIDHLAAGFLLCHNISHGINLRKSPVLQYLYYLAQIGLCMSPLSNNSLFLDYHKNPFLMFFQRGLNVSLSTDDPLQIHLTKEPLVEEYSVAAKVCICYGSMSCFLLWIIFMSLLVDVLQVWKLSSCDLCEIARNSVYQSGFLHAAKLHWLGDKYFMRGPEGNDIHKTNVPRMRIAFRHETWKEEMQYVYSGNARIPEEIDF